MSIYIQLFLASLFWGSNVIVMKILLNKIPFLLLATIRVFLSFVFLWGYMKIKKFSFSINHKGKIFIIGFLAIYMNFYLTFVGMNEVKGIDNAFMNALAPILTFVFSIFLLGKKGKMREYIALFLTCLAFLLSIHFQIFSIRIGFWYLFSGMLFYMLANVMIQKWELGHSIVLTLYELFYGLILLAIHCVMSQQFSFYALKEVSLFEWVLFLVISGVGFAFIQVTYIQAIEKIGAFQTSFYLSLNPIVTYIESLIFLHEQLDILHVIGFIILGISIFIMNRKVDKITQST